ncbi:MAG: M23 family metallopeptidase [Saprospiraceae bacterium]|nr:M23 family metallopeptidase [Saprospiraceae bacterium]
MRVGGFLLLSFLLVSFAGDQPIYPAGDFIWPVKHAIKVSGTFGELRPNHFHAGVDLKSERGVTGDRLYAAGSGYVSRIKIQAAGYGNALYITHPNGYTTLYAHLQNYTPEIAKFVKEQQYSRESFEVDLYLTSDLFPLNQGDYIGNMGTTGSSQGPHLHFEIRDSKTEKPVNPLLFGLKIPDSRPPQLHELKLYGFDADGRQLADQRFDLRLSSGVYRVTGDTISSAFPKFGLALKTFDRHDNVSNWNGIYGLKMWVDDTIVYQYDMESFAFDETRSINALLDYPERVSHRSYFYRCFGMPGNALSLLAKNKASGLLDFESAWIRKIKIEVSDVDGNAASTIFWVKEGAASTSSPDSNFQYILPYDESSLIQEEQYALFFPLGTLFENLYLHLSTSADKSYGHYSDVLHVADYLTPVNGYFDVALRPNKEMSPEEKSKAFIAFCGRNGDVVNFGGSWEDNGLLHAKTNEFGNFTIMVDNRPPTIENISLRSDMRGRSSMVFKIYDNYPTGRAVRDLIYRGTIDGNWVLMEFDAKSKRLKYRMDGSLARGEHDFKLVLTDAVGNETVYERSFRN